MKLLKNLLFMLFVFTLSCSNSDDSTEQEKESSVSITFSDGRSYIMESTSASLRNEYSTDTTNSIVVASVAPFGAGNLIINLYDDDTVTNQIVNENSFSFVQTAESTFYATLSFQSEDSIYYGLTGSLEILNFEPNGDNSRLSAIFNTSDGNGLTMSGNLFDVKMNCTLCE